MSLLFDISPEEPQKRRAARAPIQTGPNQPEKGNSAHSSREAAATVEIIAKIDDHFTCADESCGSSAHDIIGEDGGEWAIECAMCGTGQRVRAIKGHIQPKPKEFQFNDGRFAGLTLSETAERPRGLDYLRWAAESHPRQSVQDSCRTWLASHPQAG